MFHRQHVGTDNHLAEVITIPTNEVPAFSWSEPQLRKLSKRAPRPPRGGRVSSGDLRSALARKSTLPEADGHSSQGLKHAENGRVTVRSQSGHSQVTVRSAVRSAVRSWFFTYKLKIRENQGEADGAY